MLFISVNLNAQEYHTIQRGATLPSGSTDSRFFIRNNGNIYWHDGTNWVLQNAPVTAPNIVTSNGNILLSNGSTIWIRTGGIVSTFVSGTPAIGDKFKFRCYRTGSCGFNISGTPDFIIEGTTYTAPDLIGLGFGQDLIFEMSSDGKIYGEIK